MLGVLLILAAVHDLAGRTRGAHHGLGVRVRAGEHLLQQRPAQGAADGARDRADGLRRLEDVAAARPLGPRADGRWAAGSASTTRHMRAGSWSAPAVLIVLHAAIRRRDRPLRAMPLVYAVIIAGFIAAPAIVQVTSNEEPDDAPAVAGREHGSAARITGRPNANNLALESRRLLDARQASFANLPKRMRDILIRPYPWQIANPSQQLGAVGRCSRSPCFAADPRGVAAKRGRCWRSRDRSSIRCSSCSSPTRSARATRAPASAIARTSCCSQSPPSIALREGVVARDAGAGDRGSPTRPARGAPSCSRPMMPILLLPWLAPVPREMVQPGTRTEWHEAAA